MSLTQIKSSGIAEGAVTTENIGTLSTLSVTGNANVGNIGATNAVFTNVSGNGNALTALDASNISSGTLDQARLANASLTLGSTSLTLGTTTTTIAGLSSVTSTSFVGALTGAATSAGTVTTNAQPNITSVGTLTSLAVTGNASAGNLSTAGVLSVTGNANVGNIGSVVGVFSGNLDAANLNTAGLVNATGNISGGNIITAGLVSATGNISGGNIITAGLVSATGNISGGNVNASGKVVSSTLESNVSTGTAPLTVSSTTLVTNLNADLLDGYNTAVAATANTVVVRDANANITGNNISGTLSTASQPNVTSVGILSSLAVTGNTDVSANINVDTVAGKTGSINIIATGEDKTIFLKPTGIGTVNVWDKIISNVALPTAASDAATKGYVDSVAEGLHVHASVAAATPNTLAVLSGGTVSYDNGTSGVGATLTTDGTYATIDGINIATVGTRILVKNEANAAHNGIYVYTSSTVLTRANDYDTAAEIQAGDFTFVSGGTLYNSTGWVQIDDVTTVGTDPIEWEQFSGAGTYLAGTGLTLAGDTFSISNTAVTAASYGSGDAVATFTVNAQGQLTAASNVAIAANAANLTGSTLSSNITTSSLTSVGTLGSLAVTGNVSAGNVSATGISGTTLGGTLTTAAQPNITSVGTLTSTTTSGNLNFSSASQFIKGDFSNGTFSSRLLFQSNTGTFTDVGAVGPGATNSAAWTAYYGNDPTNTSRIRIVALSDAAYLQSSITGSGSYVPLVLQTGGSNRLAIDVNGNVGIANSLPTHTLSVTGTINVSGNANVGNIGATSGVFTNVSGNGAALTALNASNISSGTLTQARLANSNVVLGSTTLTLGTTTTTIAGLSSVTSTTFVGALTGAATTAGTVTTAAQANITSVGTLTSLNVSGNFGLANTSPAVRFQIGNLTSGATATPETISLGGSFSNAAGNNIKLRVYDDSDGAKGGMGVSSGQLEINVWSTGRIAFMRTTTKMAEFDSSNNLIPGANGTYNLGSSTNRWNTVFTSDLDLNNGIGDWTIVEGEDDLFIYNNKRNKVYKFNLTEVNPATATPKKEHK